jgi:hypothetical protein
MVFKALLIIVIVAILMEDGTSIKKTEEEKREDKELAELVNKTLAEEAEKKEEEDEKKRQLDPEKKRDEIKKKKDEKKEKKGDVNVKGKDLDEACPPLNSTCPDVEPCVPCKECGSPKECQPCQDCPPVKRCDPCPEVGPCEPCKPCLEANGTTAYLDCPSPPSCMEPASMSVPEAMAVGAIASLLITGVATAIGLLLRYTSPIFSGLLFVFIVVLTWYLSSHYPETARELGGRVVATLREATVALGHRVMEAIRHQEQVCVPYKSNLFFGMSSMFHLKSLH